MRQELKFNNEEEFRKYLKDIRKLLEIILKEEVKKYQIKDVVEFVFEHEKVHFDKATKLGYKPHFVINYEVTSCEKELKLSRLEVSVDPGTDRMKSLAELGYSMKKIVRIIKKVFEIEERYTLPDNTYHTFFHLKKLI